MKTVEEYVQLSEKALARAASSLHVDLDDLKLRMVEAHTYAALAQAVAIKEKS